MQSITNVPTPPSAAWGGRWFDLLLLVVSLSCLASAFGLHREAEFFDDVAVPLSGHAVIEEGTAIARLRVDRLGLETVVAEGSSPRVLRRSAGRLSQSGRILADGAVRGNVVLAAHRDTHFRPLQGVEPGDVLELEGPDGAVSYVVDWTRVVDPDAVWVTEQRGRDELTLVTCYPFRWIGPAPERFIVRARKLPP
ncbi:MAG: class D sortase, partial [Acidobacteriota bacterium]